jgi:N,N'-diacetyllegionaminate synthase
MIDTNKLVPEYGYIIAETACGHNGSMSDLKELIDAVANSKADGIKLQIFTTDERSAPGHSEWEIFTKLTLSQENWQEAVQYCKDKKLDVWADIFGHKGFLIAKEAGVDAYKIHSEDLLNTRFIEDVVKEKKVTMLGVGGAHRSEIRLLINHLSSIANLDHLILMTGVQVFPTPLEIHSLNEVQSYVTNYPDLKIGFADHLDGENKDATTLPLMALAAGASVIEKHITIDRTQKWEDFESALDKETFKSFTEQVKRLSPLLRKQGEMTAEEKQYRYKFKKTAISNKVIEKGSVIKSSDIDYIKNDEQKIPLPTFQIQNKKVAADLKEGEFLSNNKISNTVGAIIVARCSSTRLNSKALKKINDKETITLLIDRIKKCKNIDHIILATSTDEADDILEEIAIREGILPFRGSLENLSLRFYEAAEKYNIDHIIRITGDDILRDNLMIDNAVESHLEKSSQVTITGNMPYGMQTEIFTKDSLKLILDHAVIPSNTEYLEWYLENNRYFSVNYCNSDYDFESKWRLTLDYEEDFQFFDTIFKHFDGKDFDLIDTIQLLKSKPEISKINEHKTAKFTMKDLNVEMKI